MIAIIDYGMGNLRSVQKAFEAVGADAVVTHAAEDIQKSEKVVLPGVGAMRPAMEKLRSLGLTSAIEKAIASQKPFLGICLGLQLLFEKSDEGGAVQGLGVLPGEVVRFTKLKVPHMGWNQIRLTQSRCPLFTGMSGSPDVYFCHSYFVKPVDGKMTAASTDYGIDFASAVALKNIFGVQFHPEKSQATGLKIIKNFTEIPS